MNLLLCSISNGGSDKCKPSMARCARSFWKRNGSMCWAMSPDPVHIFVSLCNCYPWTLSLWEREREILGLVSRILHIFRFPRKNHCSVDQNTINAVQLADIKMSWLRSMNLGYPDLIPNSGMFTLLLLSSTFLFIYGSAKDKRYDLECLRLTIA